MTKKSVHGSKCLVMSIIGFFLSSAAVFLVPFASFKEQGLPYTLSYVIGGVFWSGLLIGIIFTVILNKVRTKEEKKLKAENKSKRKRNSNNARIGVFTFFSNRIAKIFDIIFIVAIIVQLSMMFFDEVNSMVAVTTLFLVIFAFEMHCVFNGKNYLYLMRARNSSN